MSVIIDEPNYPDDPQTALTAYMLMDGYTGEQVQAYLDWAFPQRDPGLDRFQALVDEWASASTERSTITRWAAASRLSRIVREVSR